VRGTAAIANGGVLVRPTLLLADGDAAGKADQGVRVMQPSTSDTMRKLMRLVVTDGFGKSAEVPGYYPGGKTGTAEKVGAHGYKKHANVAAFMSVFPMNVPRYAVYMMLDEPQANASTHGYATAGWVSAPAAGRVIARMGPMVGLLPDIEHKAAIDQALYIPLQPARPAGAARTPPVAPAAPPVAALPPGASPASTAPGRPFAPRPARDVRREAALPVHARLTSLAAR
jgi:cell division protein FtsI (penicillin-binding protein 3)